MKKILSLSLILILISGLFAGCKKDKGDPPVLPPAESMTIEFSNFINNGKSEKSATELKGVENSNWVFAALSVTTWNLIITGTLAVPVASFKLAIDQDPVSISKNNWQWSYSFPVGSSTYKARLTGQIRTSDVEWKMFISKEGTGAFAEFLWFEGTSDLNGTSGQWILNESNASQTPIVQIDWEKSGDNVGSVKYTYVKENNFKDSTIEYGLTSTNANGFNAYYDIYFYNTDLGKFSTVNIEWSTVNHNGRVKSVDYLGDDQWYCWDTNKVNGDC